MAAANPETEREPVQGGRYGGRVVALAQELERLKATAKDVVVPTADLMAVVDHGRILLEAPDLGRLPVNRWGTEQLVEKAGKIPMRYFDDMTAAGLADLAAANVNAWLQKKSEDGKDRLLIRAADGRIRAVLSGHYRVLDNYDLAILTMERAKDHGAEIQECSLTDQRMYVKLVVPKYKEYLEFTDEEKRLHTWHEVMDKDEVVPGLVVSNSEVGAGAFRVEPFLFRRACSNGCIGEESLYRIHLGREMEIGVQIFSDETRQLEDRALWSKVRDVIDSTFNPAVLKVLVDKMRAARGQLIPVPEITKAVDIVAKDLTMSKEKRDSLLAYFSKEGNTVFGLVNGITRLAQDYASYDDQVALERYAGRVLARPEIVVQVR